MRAVPPRALLGLLALAFAGCADEVRSPETVVPGSVGGGRDATSVRPPGTTTDAGERPDTEPDPLAQDATADEEDAARSPDVGTSRLDAAPGAEDAERPGPDAAGLAQDAAVELPVDAAPAGPTCGDGVPEPPEVCDDGNRMNSDYCAADCRVITGRCGDGERQPNETCDDGVLQAACDTWHDGGDGTCVAPGVCAGGFVLDGPDCVPSQVEPTIDIFVDNFCNMMVVPPTYDVAVGQTARFTYRNRSVDYPVDVWLSYGGGFLDLPTGDSWEDRFEHCTGPRRPRQAAADISTACSEHRFVINCLD